MITNKFTKLFIIGFSMFMIFFLMLLTVDPDIQYSVDDIMKEPDEYGNLDIFVRGEVENSSLSLGDNFFNISGINYVISVDYSGASLPEGFHEGLTVAIKGKLINVDGQWTLFATEVITGCPSKYETVDNS
ncbi:MAG: cytochrome c maturation protein CcmE [Candidatus Thalassarchaeaceae archaeon]|nr:cytochrome c maturation protein CcmE [Candidatus Thalassarchaeaceae archaeon]